MSRRTGCSRPSAAARRLRKIRQQVPKATINDQFLCIVGGALHAYLARRTSCPTRRMIAMVPMTLRGAEKGDDVATRSVHGSCRCTRRSPTRSSACARSAIAPQTSKRVTDAVGKELARDLLEYAAERRRRHAARNVKLPRIGLIVSNVRGPDVPLYMAGAQLVNYAPISIAIDGMGLNVTGFSYAGTMWICAVSCREMLPDPAFFADCLRAAFEQMKEAAARAAAFTVAERAAARGRRPRRRASKAAGGKRRSSARRRKAPRAEGARRAAKRRGRKAAAPARQA